MKVLHALHGFPPEFLGGSELYVERLARVQKKDGHQVCIVAGTNRGEGREVVSESLHGIAVHRIRKMGLFHERWDHGPSPRVSECFSELIRGESPDLVHVHQWVRLSLDLVRRTRETGRPCVVTAHDAFPTCPRIFRVRPDEAFCERPLSVENCLDCVPREEWMGDAEVKLRIHWFAGELHRELSLASALLVPSLAHARLLSRFTEIPTEKFQVIPNGSILEWKKKRGPGWETESRPLRIAHWGHLKPMKGVHVLLEALRILDRPGEIRLLLWGRPEDEAYAKRLRELNQGLEVERLESFQSGDLEGLQADLAVFPTLAHESHAFVLDEAFALGLPVLVSDRGALPERCAGGGKTFPPGDAAALAALIGGILDDPKELGRLRKALPRPIGFKKHWAALWKVYEPLLKKKHRRPPAAAAGQGPGEEDWESLVLRLEERAREMAGLRKKAEDEGENMRKALAEFRGSLQEYEALVGDQKEDIETRKLRMAELGDEVETYKVRLSEVEEDLSGHREELSRVEKDFRTAESEVRRLRGEVEELRGTLDGLEGALAREKADRRLEGERSQAVLAEKDRILGEFQESIEEYRRELRRLENWVEDLEGERARFDMENRRLFEDNQELRGENMELRREKHKLERENRLALPLVLPARLLLALKDRIFGKPEP